jgi:hypothetical protein
MVYSIFFYSKVLRSIIFYSQDEKKWSTSTKTPRDLPKYLVGKELIMRAYPKLKFRYFYELQANSYALTPNIGYGTGENRHSE